MRRSFASIQNAIGLGVLLAIGLAAIRLALAVASYTPGTQPTGWVAQGDLSNYNLTSGNETLYRTEYEREFWSGNLHAFPVSATGQVSQAADRWTGGAADMLDAQNWDTGRLIATMMDDGSKVPFRAASLSPAQQGMLSLTLATTTWTATDVVNYLRGERTNEGLNLPQMRYRKHVLGDIVHSRPYYVADSTHPTVFVEANDGMLHAFNAADGSERWAYVPSMLIPKLKTYANNPYTHDYFADGQINIGSVIIGGVSKRVLVGGLGAGGKGLFALDITDSAGLTAATETDVANKILWEIERDGAGGKRNHAADANYDNLGYTYSTPAMVKVPGGQDAVIIGNGYNDAGDYQAYLLVINAADGSLIRAIAAGSSGTAASPNGLGSPYPVDSNFDGMADIVYAGDLNGTLWKFDLSSTTAATALYTTSPAQPITANVAAARHPQGGYMVTFGTGGLFSSMDMTDTSTYYVYGVWDGAPVANVGMQTQTIEERSYGGTTRVRRASNNPMTGYRGWKVALPPGERVLGEGTFIENGTYFFTTYDPTKTYVPPATTTTVYGENWLMELDYLSGGSGSDNRPIFDMNGDLLLTDADRLTYTASDPLPTGKNVGDPILTTDGIIVGKFQDHGVMSQPLLVQLATLNYTLFNQNPDVYFPAIPVDYGVTGGHFDADIYYGAPICGDTSSGGADATVTGYSACSSKKHVHQYDDKYNVTGVNTLNPSNTLLDIKNAIPSTATRFKVLMHNQYLNPAVKLHIGDPTYLYNVDAGYIPVKNYLTSNATLDLATLPTYSRATVGSLALNMPKDALTAKNWWGNGDVRAGLHPTKTGCVKKSAGTGDSNLYQPVRPPANGVDGPGVNGTAANGYAGVRHNGALTLQLIKDTTPNSAIELNDPDGRPEYGWRVKKQFYDDYVLAEWTLFWHHPNGLCYGSAGWTKAPGPDNGSSSPFTPAAGSTDPKIGDLSGGGGAVTSTVTTITTDASGNEVIRTVITYANGTMATIVRTHVVAPSYVLASAVTLSDGTTLAAGTTLSKGYTLIETTDALGHTTTDVVAPTEGCVGAGCAGGNQRGDRARTGRVSWHEIVRD